MNESKPRWRCADCGSTRVTAIQDAYAVGRLDPMSEVPHVDEEQIERFELHPDAEAQGIQCSNCQGGRVRREGPRRDESRYVTAATPSEPGPAQEIPPALEATKAAHDLGHPLLPTRGFDERCPWCQRRAQREAEVS